MEENLIRLGEAVESRESPPVVRGRVFKRMKTEDPDPEPVTSNRPTRPLLPRMT
jgi:hypothetical protein